MQRQDVIHHLEGRGPHHPLVIVEQVGVAVGHLPQLVHKDYAEEAAPDWALHDYKFTLDDILLLDFRCGCCWNNN